MIFLHLFLGFLKVGCFAFGGAYGAIPLIRDVVMSYGWMDEEALTYMIAVSESTPGPIMVNLATYVGSHQAGLFGSLLATLAVVLPSFLIILAVMALLRGVIRNPWVQAALRGMKPCVMGIVLATGVYLMVSHCWTGQGADGRACIMTVLLAGVMIVFKRIRKKKLSPISLIVMAACLGMVVYGL